jgi:hypothetical protein
MSPQNLSQLFGRVAEEQFNCIFLRNFAQITDEDRYALADFVDYIKTFRVKVQRTKVVMREHDTRKAALIRLKGKGDKSMAAGRRNAVMTYESGNRLVTGGYGIEGALEVISSPSSSANVSRNASRQTLLRAQSFST